MALTSDTQQPRLNVPFTVTVSIQVKENVASLPNVYLPSFFGPEELGDERTYVHGRDGTLYRETLTLEAHASGPLHISPAKMDAIDARDGKPKRFSSNDLNLYVGGAALPNPLSAIVWFAAVVFYGGLALAAAFVVIAIFARRRAARPAVTEIVAAADPPAPPVPVDEYDVAVRALRERRDRAHVLEVRAALWRSAGANEGETLQDVLKRLAAGTEERRRLATLIEHAAFIEDSRLAGAIEDFLNASERSVYA
jgi:hypothetical protein